MAGQVAMIDWGAGYAALTLGGAPEWARSRLIDQSLGVVAAITVNHSAAEGSWLELRLPRASHDRVEGSPNCPTHVGLLGCTGVL
jgi:hypothetical protein